MNFVVCLLKTLVKYDSTWVIMDRLMKFPHFIPMQVTYNVDKLAQIYLKEIVRLHGIPISIASNRCTQFT